MMEYTSANKLKRDCMSVTHGEVIPQRQDSLTDQLADLHTLANRFGLHDAADFIRRHLDLDVNEALT